MKYIKIFSVMGVILIYAFFVLGCLSTQQSQTTVDNNFLGDFDPIKLESIMAWYPSFGKEKPKELSLYFVPRTNTVEIYYRDDLNRVVLILPYSQRQALLQASMQFAQDIQNDVLQENRKPTKKNAYSTSFCGVGWGVTGVARYTNKALLEFNYKYLDDKRPYFMLKAHSSPDNEDSSVYSPVLFLYFSPSQLESLQMILNQEHLQSFVDELNKKAYQY